MADQVLSQEEVDAILKASQDKNQQDLSQLVGSGESQNNDSGRHYQYAMSNINEILRVEYEKYLTAFLRKRIVIKMDSFNFAKASACLNANDEKVIYSIFRINPKDDYGMVLIDFSVLHQTINLLYGGKLNTKETIIESPGKIGTIIAEKISLLCLNSFAAACHEFGPLNYEIVKTTSSHNLATNLGLGTEDEVYILELTVFFDEFEAKIKLLLSEAFFPEFIPVKADGHKHREKDFWRTAIKTQVVDSLVTISVSLPDVTMKVKDFMALKDGDIVPISDPTMVYVCLNNLKLFRASAGQANSKRVAKIINQI